MDSPPPPPSMEFPLDLLDEPSPAQFEWSNLLDFTFEDEDQFNLSWSPNPQTTATTDTSPNLQPSVSSETSNQLGSDNNNSSDKIRKRDPRLICENFLAGRIPCACPEVDAMMAMEEENEVVKKRPRKAAVGGGLLRCQVPGCEVDITELKGYHKRHRVCLRCATASSVVLDGGEKRYCQQCGKFHILPDFDEGKRSCRRKLERHNKRRRRKSTESKGEVEKERQVDQQAGDITGEGKAEKDDSLNESEDGNASPISSHPGSQSTQSESIKSFVTFAETQIEGGKDNLKCSSVGDNKNAYSSMCPTGRISFKLYDWNPAEFPRRLRHQIFQWLANMPVELEGYIRPGCTILTVFIAMPPFMWEKLSEDASRHMHDFIRAPESMLYGRGSMTVYLNDMIFRFLKGGASLMNIKVELLAPRLHYVQPSCFEAGKPMEFLACGSNLIHSRFRFLVSFAGRYLAYDDCVAILYERTGLCNDTDEDNDKQCEHQMYKICVTTTDPTLSGPAFVEVESEFGLSNFIPILIGDKHVCSELKIVQQRVNKALFSKEIQHAALDVSSKCKNFVRRQTTISELLLDIGWLLKEPKSDGVQNQLTITQVQRFNCLLSFLIQNESASILMEVLHSLNIIKDATMPYNYDNTSGNADMKLFQKNMEHAQRIVHQKLQHVGEHDPCLVEKEEYQSERYGENDTHSAVPSTSEEMDTAKKKSLGSINAAFRESNEATPLINKDVVMNLPCESQSLDVWPRKPSRGVLSTRVRAPRSLFLLVTASVVCFGICAVVIHPGKVGDLAVSIRRCLFGSSRT